MSLHRIPFAKHCSKTQLHHAFLYTVLVPGVPHPYHLMLLCGGGGDDDDDVRLDLHRYVCFGMAFKHRLLPSPCLLYTSDAADE